MVRRILHAAGKEREKMGAFHDWECVPLSRFVPVGKALSSCPFVPEPPSLFFARERAYRNPHLKGKDQRDSFIGVPYQVLNRNCQEREDNVFRMKPVRS